MQLLAVAKHVGAPNGEVPPPLVHANARVGVLVDGKGQDVVYGVGVLPPSGPFTLLRPQ